MGILSTLRFIRNHPLNETRKLASLCGFVRWQIGSRLAMGAVAVPFVNETRLLVKQGMTGATLNIYCGLHELEDMAFVLHALRKNDGFVDVGANIGSYTVLACGVVGARCVSIEPIPETYNHLMDNIHLNGIGDQVLALNIGVGNENGTLFFTSELDTLNHVLDKVEQSSGSIAVNIEMLDEVLADFEPQLIKIDVEGFETNVIAGAHKILARDSLIAVIMELNGSGHRYGFDDDQVHQCMLRYGFKPFRYLPFDRKLVDLNGKNTLSGNTLYVRNEEKISLRLKNAPPFMTSIGVEV